MGALKQENYSVKNASVFNTIELGHMAEKVFGDAIAKANQNKQSDAMDLAQEALVYANMSQSTLRTNIHKFLGFINFEIGKFSNARIHCYQAIQSLNMRHKHYWEDKEYFEKMQEMIEKKMQLSKLKVVQ